MSGSESSHTLETARGDANTLTGAHQPSLRMTHFGAGARLDYQCEIARGLQVRGAELDHESQLLAADVAEAGPHALPHPGRTERHPHRQLRLSGIRERDLAGGQGGILFLNGHFSLGELFAQIEDLALL